MSHTLNAAVARPVVIDGLEVTCFDLAPGTEELGLAPSGASLRDVVALLVYNYNGTDWDHAPVVEVAETLHAAWSAGRWETQRPIVRQYLSDLYMLAIVARSYAPHAVITWGP